MQSNGLGSRPWYRWSPRDFRSDAAVFQMDREQRWRYRDALDDSWLSEAPGVATEEQWRKWLGYSENQWGAVRETFAAAFVVDGDTWTQRRLAAEAEHALERSRKGQVANKVRWGSREDAPRIPQGCSEDAPGILRGSSSHPDTDTEESKTISAPPVPRTVRERNGKAPEPKPSPEGFEQFWTAYACPRRTGKPVALALWRSLGCEKIAEAVLAELERFKATQQWRGGFMPEPARWLKKAPWVDGPTAPAAGGDQW